MSRINGVSGNVYVGATSVFACESAFDEQVIANVTATADTTDYKVGSASSKMAIGAAFGTTLAASKAITSLDISGYTEILAWIKSSAALSANDWNLNLDDTALCGSPVVNLNIPALSANAWTLCEMAGTLTGCTAIISVGLTQAVDKGAMNLWLDDIKAAKLIAGIKAWTLNYVADTQESTAFDSTGVASYLSSISHWAGSFDGFKDGAPLGIGSIVTLSLQESTTSTQKWLGNAIITNATPKTDVKSLVTYNYTFQGTGSLTVPTA